VGSYLFHLFRPSGGYLFQCLFQCLFHLFHDLVRN
jgi:hypothetical protein